MIPGLRNINRLISNSLEKELDRIGLLYRAFSREKDLKSLHRKIQTKGKYSVDGKKVQDIIGIRVVTYFEDDIKIVSEIIKEKYEIVELAVDNHDTTVFKPKRHNIVCRFDEKQQEILNEIKAKTNNKDLELVDDTFEVQLRTILSEGWHEIDHNLRYKCKKDWDDYPDNERQLNGIYATLETNDQALSSLFENLSHSHYKNKNWEAMLRTKFRLKFQHQELDKKLISILNEDELLSKNLFRVSRKKILKYISETRLELPINFNNIIYLVNNIDLKNSSISVVTPEIIQLQLE